MRPDPRHRPEEPRIVMLRPPAGQGADDHCTVCDARLRGVAERERNVCDDCHDAYTKD